MTTCYIGLGSNLENPVEQVQRAFEEIAALPDTTVAAVSSLYRSAPMGPSDQPDYINAVARIETRLAPHVLLDALQAIEHNHGRLRGAQRWGPRPLDLDLLLYGDQILRDERLTVPHAGLGERNFVLYPLQEVAPADLVIPALGGLAALLSHCSGEGLEKITP